MVTKKEKELKIVELREKLIPLLKQHKVSRAAIFGSTVTGRARQKTGDLDLLVEFEGEKNLLDLVALKLDLEAEINRKVDVLTYQALNPLIRQRVLKEEVRVL